MNATHSHLPVNLKYLRESMSLSRDALAAIVGSSASHIAKLESGTTKEPSWDVIRRLSSFFGVSGEELMDETLTGLNQKEQALKRAHKNFDEDHWISVIDLIEGITRRQATDGKFRNS